MGRQLAQSDDTGAELWKVKSEERRVKNLIDKR